MIFKTYFIDTFSTCIRNHRAKNLDHFLPSVGLNAKGKGLLSRMGHLPPGVKPSAAGRLIKLGRAFLPLGVSARIKRAVIPPGYPEIS